MDTNFGDGKGKLRLPWAGLFIALAALGVGAVAGCARHSLLNSPDAAFARVFTPQVPEFLSGPSAAILTNSGGFSARVTFESSTPLAPKGVEVTEGELLANGTKLLFAPRSSDPPNRDIQLGGFSFIWDVATGSGYVLSEALQGYAAVSSSLKVTGLAVQPGSEGSDENAVVTVDNGSHWLFHLWRSAGAGSLPMRIRSVTNAPAFTLKLAKLRHEPPPAGLFAPPEGFAKFASPEALADELAARKSNVRRGGWSEAERFRTGN